MEDNPEDIQDNYNGNIKLPKRLEPKIRDIKYKSKTEIAKFDPYEMNDQVFEMITKFLSLRNFDIYTLFNSTKRDNREKINSRLKAKFIVNKFLPNKPHLWESYVAYRGIYYKNLEIKKKQELLDQINEEAQDMEDHLKFGLSITKKRVKTEKDDPYKKYYDFLDLRIDEVENLIYLGVSPKKICLHLSKFIIGLTPIIYHHWKDSTKHINRIIFAYKASAEEHMNLSKEFMEKWLSNKDLDMQHVGIVREVALWHSRMAGFYDRKKFGAKVEIIDDKPAQKVLKGADIVDFLSEVGKAAKRINDMENAEEIEEEDKDKEEEENGYSDFEEIK